MELLHYWKLIRKRMWLIVAIVVIAMAGVGYFLLNQPPLYRTSTTLVINPATLDSTVNYQITDGMLPLANTYSEFLKSRSFANTVLQQLQTQALPITPTEDEILGAIMARYIDDTQLFRITATYRDPIVAKALADTTAQMLVQANNERILAQQTALMNAQLDTRRVQEIDRLGELTNLLRDELNYYEDHIAALEQQLTILSSGPASAETDARMMDTRSELLASRAARVDLLGSLAQAQESLLAETEKANRNLDTVVVVDEAVLPSQPLPRNIIQPILAALAAALALGILLAVVLDYFDASVKSPEELDTFYNKPTLGAIGIVNSAANSPGQEGNLVMLNEPHSAVAETIRVVRTAVQIASLDQPLQSLLITSAVPGEGKSFIATNLAISIAQAGKRVILVDADLRRPQIHKAFGMHSEPGFTNLVVDQTLSLQRVLQPTRVPNLRILACGTIPPNPAELLTSGRASIIMQTLSANADMVIYDSSPVTMVTDAVILATQVDGVVQVVNANGTNADLVRRCKDLLERSGANVLGPVLNRVATPDLGYYGNYYSERPERRSSKNGNTPAGQGVDMARTPQMQERRQPAPMPISPAERMAVDDTRGHNGHVPDPLAPGVPTTGDSSKPFEDA
jgi:non-specific protein-tyrosine kinase